MSNLLEIKALSDGMNRLWESFKADADKRLKSIEERKWAPADLEEKLAKMNADLDKIDKDLRTKWAELEARLKTPERETKSEEQRKLDEHRKVFFEYGRKGLEQIPLDTRKVLVASDDASGGYLAPSEFVSEIIKGLTVISPVRELARIRATSNRTVRIPVRTGVPVALWTTEVGTRNESTGLAYGIEEVPNHELFARIDISSQELEDAAFDMEAQIREEATEQIGLAEGTSFIKGTGAGQPEGIITSSKIQASGVTSYTNGAITPEILITAQHAIKMRYADNATWLFNRSTISNIRKLREGSGTGQFLWAPALSGSLVSGDQPTILGRPYREAPDLDPDVTSGGANKWTVIYGDFSKGYTIIDRVGISMLRDPFSAANQAVVRFYVRKRVGGQVTLGEAITAVKTTA